MTSRLPGMARLALLALLALGPAFLVSCSPAPAPAPDAQPTGSAASEQVDCAVARCVALTFDDGPSQYTGRLLDELKAAEAPATFFLVGKNIAKYPDAVKRMAAEGHQLGSHTWDHAHLTTLTREQIQHELGWTSEAVEKASGHEPTVFRPPYGNHGAVYDRLVPYPLVLWDVDTLDWKHHDPEKTVRIAMDEVHPGSIILMHDIHESSVKALPDLVEKLKAEGYTPVTVDQLFNGQLENSTAYASAPAPGATK
ncbi:polysaccharide deacetylase family protein [Micrococcus antarcticus]